jgi:competence protein ComEC
MCIIFIRNKKYSYRFVTGIFFQLIFFVTGFFYTSVKDKQTCENYFTKITEDGAYVATIMDQPKAAGGKCRINVSIDFVSSKNGLIPSVGNCYAYFKNDSNAEQLQIGQKICFTGMVASISPPLNPGQFDFKFYSSIRRINNQFFIQNNSWKKLDGYRESSLKSIASKLRNSFLHVYRKAGISGQEYAVLSALVLGYDDEIDAKIMKAYSASGTLHILSVSGMHVGIIFTALSSIFSFMERKKSLRWFRVLILLTILWFYAFLTGLSPSVIRSTMMFSFIIIGKSLNRNSNIYNSLSMSAFCIFIFFDTLLLFDVGLQLSFIAVAGIAYLYPGIYRLFEIKNSLQEKIWALIAVSVAAQLATFPITLYYFHQFPNYFILANLIIIPLSTIGIFAGILLLFIQPFEILFKAIGIFTRYVIFYLNKSAILFQDLPGSVWRYITLHLNEMVIIYLALYLFRLFLVHKAIKYLYQTLALTIILLLFFIHNNYWQMNEKSLLVFSNTRKFCGHFTIGNYSWIFYHKIDSLQANKFSEGYCIWQGIPVTKRNFICLDDSIDGSSTGKFLYSNNYLSFNGYLIFDSSWKMTNQCYIDSVKPDLIYISNLNSFNPENISSVKLIANKILKSNLSDSVLKRIHYLNEGSLFIKL